MVSTVELQSVTAFSSDGEEPTERPVEHISTASAQPTASAVESLAPVTQRDQIIVLICGFFSVFQTIGPNLSYGVFQSYYTSSSNTMLPPDEASNRAMVAFIGTLGAGLTWGGSIFVQPLTARVGSNRAVALVGGVLMSIGFLLASFSTSTWQLLLTQGLTYGVGSSLLYFPLVTIAAPYFTTRRASATGFILSAAGIGGLVYSFTIQGLLASVGPRWTLRVMALEAAIVCTPISLAARKSRTIGLRSEGGVERMLVSSSIAKTPAFLLQFAAGLLQSSGNFLPMTYTPEFSTILGYSATYGAALLALNNGINSVARIVTGLLADRFGNQNILVVSVFGSAVSVLALWMDAALKVDEGAKASWLTFIVLYGILAGGYNSLFPAVVSELFPLSAYASVNGFLYFSRGLGALFGSPVGGQILGDSRSLSTASDVSLALQDYRKLIWYDGALLLACSFCVAGIRVADAVDQKQWRWRR